MPPHECPADHPSAQPVAIAFGANIPSSIGPPGDTIAHAARFLEKTDWTSAFRLSSIHTTDPVGPPDQPDYANAAAIFQTTLGPRQLLDELLAVESSFGRDRASEQRWGPRTLDLDLLLYADRVIDEPGLTLPHPRLHERLFVLDPLNEIAHALVVPGFGQTVSQLRDALRA